MLKLSRNGIGVLTSQYRSVLKKCAFLNLMAAGFLMFAPHVSAAAEAGTNIASLAAMGTTIGNDQDYNVLYVTGVDGNNIKELYSVVGHERGWITNNNNVYLGQEIIDGAATHVATEISNKHSTPLTDTTSDLLPAQGGGVLSNQEGSTLIDQVVFKNNSITEFHLLANTGALPSIAAGGVLSNTAGPTGRVDIQGATFINNYAMQFTDAAGGALYNSTQDVDNGQPGKMYSTANTFSYNHAGNEDMSVSEYEEVRAGVTDDVTENITQDWQRVAESSEYYKKNYPKGASMHAMGGAVYNGGYYVMSYDKFDHNYVIGQTVYGGAVFNSLYGYYGDFGGDIGVMVINGTNSFESNHGKSINGNAFGGAIYNAGTLTFDKYSATELVFKDNYALSEVGGAGGGAIANNKFNALDTVDPVINTLHNALFEGNYARGVQAMGGAIYNSGKLELIDATFNSNSIQKIADEQNVAYGGAIYNSGLISIENDENSKDIEFNENTSALYGGAVFNYKDGIIEGTVERSIRFTGNTDEFSSNEGALLTTTPSTAGAIYGDSDSRIDITLADQGSIVFSKYAKDNVFMNKTSDETGSDGVFKVTGDNYDTVAQKGDNEPTSIDPTKTMISLGSSFTGEGKYIIENTQLNLVDGVVEDDDDVAGTGYIGFSPQMELTNVVVNMDGTMGSAASGQPGGAENSGGFMYLSSNNDKLVDNDFYITNPNAVLYYSDYDPTYEGFAIGNYIENSGLIVYDDKPENGITRSVAGYADLTTEGDTDIKIADTLVNKGVVNTALDKFITQNIHIGTLTSGDGSIFINMDNNPYHLIETDGEHKLIPEAPEGYDFGTYAGEHYASEVIYIDDSVTGTTKITLVDMDNINYTQVNLEEGQRIYFARTQMEQGLGEFTWQVENAVNDDYEIKIGYDDNGTVYDWFLYRVSEPGPTPPPPPPPTTGLDPEDMVALSLPRASLEQLRSLRLPIDRTTRGQCSCYKDNCDNSFCQYEPGSPKTRIWATPFYRKGTFERPFDVDFKLLGIDFGLDYQPTTSDLIGVFGSYRLGKYNNDGNQKHYGDETKYFSDQGGELEIKSLVGGAYYRKYIKDLYLLGAVFAGKIDADIKADNGVKGSVDGKTLGAELEIGYDIKTTRRSTVTPSVRGTYNYIKFDKGHTSNGKKISVGKINSFEIEAALKMEYQFNNSNQLPTTGYIKPSVIQMIPDGGKVKIDDKEYKKTLDNETLGRIEIGADTNLTTGFSVGVFGNYTFGSHYDAWGVGGNIKYVF